jgi:hypothetical protein
LDQNLRRKRSGVNIRKTLGVELCDQMIDGNLADVPTPRKTTN